MALVKQSAELFVTDGSGTGVVDFGSATSSANLVVLVCMSIETNAVAFSSTGFNTDASISGSVHAGGGIAILSKPGGSQTYTVNRAGASRWSVIGYEFDSTDLTASTNIEASSSDDDTTPSTPVAAAAGAIDTTVGGPIVVAYSYDRIPTVWSGPSGWTGSGTRTTAGPATQGYTNYNIATGASTNENGAVTSDAAHYVGLIIAYKASGGGGLSSTASESTTAADASSGTMAATGTITETASAADTVSATLEFAVVSSAFKNNTGTVLANLTDVTVWVNAVESGALVVKKTAQTTNASGVCTVRDAAIASATSYAVRYRDEVGGGQGFEVVTSS